MEEGGFYGFTNICTILHFFFVCVCMCMSQTQKKRKLQAGEVMYETRFMRICVLKKRREKERNVKSKWEKKKKNAAKVFST